MGWYLRKSVKFGPMRINFSRRGIGVSAGVKGLRVGTGPRGPYVAGGRGGIYFRQRLDGAKHAAIRAPAPASTPDLLSAQSAPPPPSMPPHTPPNSPPPPRTSPTGQPLVTPPVMPPSAREIRPPRYPAWALFTLTGAFALAWLCMLIGTASNGGSTTDVTNPVLLIFINLGVILIFAVQVAVCVLDWHGFTTLDGRIVWARLYGWRRAGLIFAYLCVWIMPGIYLGFACRDWLVTTRATNERAPLEQQRRISELESELGILPQTDGECRVCHKPLQAGAQFCTYCRSPVRERARVCPSCGAAALPDGQFCPKCGADL